MKMCPYCMRVSFGDFCRECGKTKSYVDEDMKLPVGSFLEGYHSYQIGAALGQGGFGVTYIALDLDTNQRVAVKEFFPVYCAGRTKTATVAPFSGQQELYEKGKERFLQEVQTMQLLEDLKSVVKVYDCFEANGTIYLVMEYVEGQSLKQWVEEHGPMEPERLFHLVRPLMEDIAAMHKEGVIHRDIAPDNIIMDREGKLRLIDFGIARDYAGEKSMTVMVKKGFAPLEQYTRNGQNAATDVYALAATFYYCLTGQTTPDAMDRLTKDELKKPSELGVQLTKRQEKALIHALGVLTKDRTQSVSAMIKELYPPVKPAKQKKPENLETVQYTQKKSAFPKGWIAAAVVLLVLAGTFGAWKLKTKMSGETSGENIQLFDASAYDYAYSDDPADNAMYTAEEFAEIVNSDNVLDILPMGTKIKMLPQSYAITDESIEFELVAYQHFQLADSQAMAKTTWMAVNVLEQARKMNSSDNNKGGWPQSELRGWLNKTLYRTLPTYWKDLMVLVQISSGAGDSSMENVSSRDYLFLPSLGEVNSYYTQNDSNRAYYGSEITPTAEEQLISVFTDAASRIKLRGGSAVNWWLRSPWAGSSNSFAFVNSGGTSYYNFASDSIGVVPCFCLGGSSREGSALAQNTVEYIDAYSDTPVYAYSDDPADNSTYTAEEFAEIVNSENVRELLPIGTKIKMIPNSKEITDESIEFELVAYKHYQLADGEDMAKTTWLAVNTLNESRRMNAGDVNDGGWSKTELRGWLNETLYPSLPDYWKDLIQPAQVISTLGNCSDKTITSMDYLFLPSLGEVNSYYVTKVSSGKEYYQSEIAPTAEEQTFSVFTDDSSRAKHQKEEISDWWLRSPDDDSTTFFRHIGYDGITNYTGSLIASFPAGVVPCFCLGGGSQKSAAASVRSIADYDYAYSDDPADNAMYTAEEFAEIVKSEDVRNLLPIGTKIKMIPNSKEITDESIEFELVAYQHFKKINSTEMAKTTWLAVNVLNEPRKMKNVNSNKGGWSGSALHGWLNETLYPTFPKYWKDLIARIQVSSTAGNHSQDIVNRAGYLFIPSLEEVDSSYDSNGFYKDEISPEAEERTFPVFSDMASRVKYRNGETAYWWLRSPWVGSSNNFAFVYSSGNVSTNTANNSYGVCPGFCM